MYDFEEIVKKGKYYYPANLRYNNNSRVICDRCYKSDLEASIGHDKLDLCLPCADIITNRIKNSNKISSLPNEEVNMETATFMEQSIFKPDNQVRTRMMQAMLNSKKKMAQGMFRK